MTHKREIGRAFSHRVLTGPVRVLLVLSVLVPAALHAQFEGSLLNLGEGDLVFQSRIMEREVETVVPLVNHVDRYIVVHLEENRVFVFEGDRAVWSSVAGTGHGIVLESSTYYWKFTTPRGLMQVRRMEKDPLWQAPDWYYIRNNLPMPAPDHSSRWMPGVMGTGAIYLGDGIAIHGTDSPELLMNPDPRARDVSHGCIRLTNEAVRELMYLVSVGTPVLIF